MEDDQTASTIRPSRPDSVSPPISDVVGVSALRKASLRLIPLITLGYITASIDRSNISFASLQMNRDLHFSASIYGLGAGLFFLSYALCEIPSNLLLYRFGARRWIARIMFTWGLLATGMMFVKTPGHFYIMRFLLGMARQASLPGCSSISPNGFLPRPAPGRLVVFISRCRLLRWSRVFWLARCST